MKKIFFSFIALLAVLIFTTCDLFGPSTKNNRGSESDEWPSRLPEDEEVRYDENGNPMHKIGMVIGGGQNGRALDQDIAMSCINYFEVVIFPTSGPYAGQFYRAAGYYPIANPENPGQPRNILWMWIPADISVQVGYNATPVICYGGYRRKRDTRPVAQGGEIMDQNKPEGFDLTLLAVGSVNALYYNTGYGIGGWVNPNTPITGGQMTLNADVWQIRFVMTALEVDGRAAAVAARKGTLEYDTFKSAVTTYYTPPTGGLPPTLQLAANDIHGMFLIKGPVDAPLGDTWVSSNGGDSFHTVNYSSVFGGGNSPGPPTGSATATDRPPGNFREWTAKNGKRVPYFELPPNNTAAPIDGQRSLSQNAHARYHRTIVAQCFVRGFFYDNSVYPPGSYETQFLQAMTLNCYVVPITPTLSGTKVEHVPHLLQTTASVVNGGAGSGAYEYRAVLPNDVDDGDVIIVIRNTPGSGDYRFDPIGSGHYIEVAAGTGDYSIDFYIYVEPGNGAFTPGPVTGTAIVVEEVVIPVASYPMAVNPTTGIGYPNILSTNEAVVKGYVAVRAGYAGGGLAPGDQGDFYWGGNMEGTVVPVYLHTGASGWAKISIDLPVKACGDNPEGDIWYIRNGMYLNLPDLGYSQDSLGGGVLIRVCDPNSPFEEPPAGMVPDELMPAVGWTQPWRLVDAPIFPMP